MPYPCSYWAVRTFGKDDPSRTKFETITQITDAFRAELTSEDEKLGRPALPKLVYEPDETDQLKKQKTAKATSKVVEAAPAFSASALDGEAKVSDADWAKAKFVIGGVVVPLKKGGGMTKLTIEKVEGQVVTLKGDKGKTTLTKTALKEAWVPDEGEETKATRWVPTRVPHTRRRRRRRRRRGGRRV